MSSVITPGSRADQIRRMEETTGNAHKVNVGAAERIACGLGGAGMIAAGLKRGSLGGATMALIGGVLAYRGITGHCSMYGALGVSTAGKGGLGQEVHKGLKVRRSFTINRSPEECYNHWRKFENLPGFMEHLESVTDLGSGRSRWVAKAPLGVSVSWEAEIINDDPGRMISWRSVEGSQIDNAGSVWFRPAPAGRGTEVTVELNYEPPAGMAGVAIARLLGEEPARQVEDDLRHFKQVMEAGEIPTVQGQASCRGRD